DSENTNLISHHYDNQTKNSWIHLYNDPSDWL
ncbi:hypothetical protein SK37_05400, partial [Citrobacter sp. MGH109]